MKKTSLSLLLALLAATAQADVRLAEVFGEHMVLQRDRPLNVWGQATPGQTLSIDLGGHRGTARAGADGRWRVQLAALPAGGPHRLVVTGDKTVVLNDILIGDVWLLGGQSNMEWVLANTGPAALFVDFCTNVRSRETDGCFSLCTPANGAQRR